MIKWHRGRWGDESVAMLTLTIRHHGRTHDLKELRQGIAAAWRAFTSGRGWQRFAAEYGLEGTVRALEVTYGPVHGWHPHLHVMLLLRRPLPPEWRQVAHARWAEAVERTLGAEFTPTIDGVFLSADPNADYPLKMGLKLTMELLSTGTKEGRVGPDGECHRSPLTILADWAQRGELADLQLYHGFVDEMAGARMLTWSRGLRERAQLAEVSDENILEGEPGRVEEEPRRRIALIAGAEWDRIRRRPGAKAALKWIARRWGADMVYYALDVLLADVDPDDLEGLAPRLRPKRPEEMDILLLLPRRGGPRAQVV